MKKYILRSTQLFDNSISDIKEYLESLQKDVKRIKNIIKYIYDKIYSLRTFPYRYPLLGFRNKLEFRKFIIQKYVVLYTIDEQNSIIWLHIIYSCRQHVEDIFDKLSNIDA